MFQSFKRLKQVFQLFFSKPVIYSDFVCRECFRYVGKTKCNAWSEAE